MTKAETKNGWQSARGDVVTGDNRQQRKTMNMKRRPSWELKNMILALSMHSWLNTKDEDERLKLAKQELEERKA